MPLLLALKRWYLCIWSHPFDRRSNTATSWCRSVLSALTSADVASLPAFPPRGHSFGENFSRHFSITYSSPFFICEFTFFWDFSLSMSVRGLLTPMDEFFPQKMWSIKMENRSVSVIRVEKYYVSLFLVISSSVIIPI